MHLSFILFHEQYLPLSLLNGILLEVHLAPAKQCFHYNPANETWAKAFGLVEGMYFKQASFSAFTADKKKCHSRPAHAILQASGRLRSFFLELWELEPAKRTLSGLVRGRWRRQLMAVSIFAEKAIAKC